MEGGEGGEGGTGSCGFGHGCIQQAAPREIITTNITKEWSNQMIDIANMALPKRSVPKLNLKIGSVTAGKTTKTKAPKVPVEKHTLSNVNTYSKAFCDGLKSEVTEGIPKMKRGRQYTAAEICGLHRWKMRDPGECKKAGEIIVDMVRNEVFPSIRVAKTKHEYPVKYELI